LCPPACGESNEITGDTVSYLCDLHRGGGNHGADRSRARVTLRAGEQPMTNTTMTTERITAALLLVLCLVFAVFV
jgi:hypothetical protein